MAVRAVRILSVLFLCAWGTSAWPQGDVRRAVYYDERYPGAWISLGQSAAARNFFIGRGYVSLNAAQLKSWMQDRITDGAPSVVVFTHDMAPDTVVETVSPDATMRRYLEAGGRIVWTGDVPLYYIGKRNYQNTRLQARGPRSVLSMNCSWEPWDEGLECAITELGGTWGLRNSWTSFRMVGPSIVDRVFAVHPNGFPAAWARRYGMPPRVGWFIRTHDTTGTGNLEELYHLAEYQEPPQTPVSPGGDFGDLTAGAFGRPDFNGLITGRWLRFGTGAPANPPNTRRGTTDMTVGASSAGGRDTWRLAVRQGAARGLVEFYVEPDYIPRDSETPAFVSVEYFDGAAGVVLGLEYSAGTSTFRPARGAVILKGTQKWRRATWYLPDARWDKLLRSASVNSGNDFRFYVLRSNTPGGSGVHIGSIRVLTERQANLRLPPGRELTFSATREGVLEADLAPMTEELRAAAPFIRAAGGTSHQTPVLWSRLEKEPGTIDFAFYDATVALHRELGLKWAPLLTLGPSNSLPDWYFDSAERQGFVCLEHGQTSFIPSIWDPRLRDHVRDFLKAFGERYRDSGVLETVVLGVTGVTGEARYPTARPPSSTGDGPRGPFHTHDGYWAGDPYALSSFRQALQAKYGTLAALNRAWGTAYAGFDAVRPFLPVRAPSLAARRDFVEWYTASLLDYTRFWLATARQFMPDLPIQVRTGGEGAPEHGSDFAALAQLAAEFHADIRFGDVGSDYVGRFATCRWVDTAARVFGVQTSHESSGDITDEGLVARIYNAAPVVVRGLKEDAAWFNRPETFDTWLLQSRLFRGWPTTAEVAFFYPQTHVTLFGSEFQSQELLPVISELRGQFDFDLVSERMIAAGALDRYRALVFGPGDVWDRATLDRIAAWVRAGGLLIAPLRIDQGLLYPELLQNGNRALGSGRVVLGSDGSGYGAFVRATLSSLPYLSTAARSALTVGDPNLGLFATALSPDGLLLLNFGDAPIMRDVSVGGSSRSLTLSPLSIVPVMP